MSYILLPEVPFLIAHRAFMRKTCALTDRLFETLSVLVLVAGMLQAANWSFASSSNGQLLSSSFSAPHDGPSRR
jgi:hypothetical protein